MLNDFSITVPVHEAVQIAKRAVLTGRAFICYPSIDEAGKVDFESSLRNKEWFVSVAREMGVTVKGEDDV